MESTKEQKRCCTCREFKAHTQFYKCKSTKDGFYAQCKKCHLVSQRKANGVRNPKLEHLIRKKELFAEGKRYCGKCSTIKNLHDFHKDKTKSDKCRNQCKQCTTIKYGAKNPHNITYRERKEFLDRGLQYCFGCKIAKEFACFYPSKGKRERSKQCKDCHTTGKVRGLLCTTCNKGIGLLKDDFNILQSAIEYLRGH